MTTKEQLGDIATFAARIVQTLCPSDCKYSLSSVTIGVYERAQRAEKDIDFVYAHPLARNYQIQLQEVEDAIRFLRIMAAPSDDGAYNTAQREESVASAQRRLQNSVTKVVESLANSTLELVYQEDQEFEQWQKKSHSTD